MHTIERIQELQEKINELKSEISSIGGIPDANEDHQNILMIRAFQSADHPMALTSCTNGKFVDVNKAFVKILGYSRKEIIGQTPGDLGFFADAGEGEKFRCILSGVSKNRDFNILLKTSKGETRSFLLSAVTIQLDHVPWLLSTFNPLLSVEQSGISESEVGILSGLIDTVDIYLAVFTTGKDNRFYIADINRRVEEVEQIEKHEVIGQCLDNTCLAKRKALFELLDQVRKSGAAHKIPVSAQGDDMEGYYCGFMLSTGNILISWNRGQKQKIRDVIEKQSAMFRKFSEMIPVMIYEVDLNGHVIYGNQLGLKMFGYTKEDLSGKMHISQIFPDNYRTMLANLEALKSPDQVSSNEYYFRRGDNKMIPIVTHSYPIFHDGKKIGYRGTVTDVSKHRDYEEQIEREKAFLEHLIDSTPEAIAITDVAGKISLVNKEFTSIFGYTNDEALNKHIDDLVVPDDLREEAVTIEKLASQKQKVIKQTTRKDKAGNRIEVSLVATAIFINDQLIANVGIYRNISAERKNLLLQEILYNISSAALKQMDIKDIYPTIVHELSKIWDTNNFFIALYDKTSDTMSLPFFADEKDKFYEIPTKNTISGYVIKNNKSVLLKEEDLKMLEESGDIDLVGTPCKVWMGVPLNVENNIIGIMCLQDYNDEDKFSHDDLYVLDFIANQIAIAIQRRIMLDNLIAARQRAEEAAQSKQVFMSTMSHEIRTPLNEVIGITNLLLQGNPRDDQMDYIKTLRFSANHLLTLVNDVLDYNKMESGKIIFEQAQFNMNDFLDEIMRSYSFRSKAKNLSFDIRREGILPSDVVGDQIRLNQVLSNLLSNALKFTSRGGISVTIKELNRKDNQSNIEFAVHDTGIGIPREKHGEIFESFTQASADTSRKYGGSGLGLAICKKLVELQGGTIRLESEPGAGSTFIFTLTFIVAEKAEKEHTTESAESFRGLEGKRILVAEDNKINFFVANKFLIGWGVIVSHAENGKLALEKLEKETFDLVLMDLHMPVMDGIEATRIIRKSSRPEINSIPIVALTAAIMSENHDKIEELNINDYVLKPFKPYDLFSRILKHVK